jgi:hypothetical protein
VRRDIPWCDEALTRRHDIDADPAERRTLSIIKNDAPDTSGVNKAAKQSAATAQEALAWAKQVYADGAGERAAASALDAKVANAQLEGMDFATQKARADDQRYRTMFQPLEDQLVADARGFDTPERRAEAAARAGADVESMAGMAVQDMNRDLLRRGGSIDDGGARGGALDLALGKARARASASDSAVRNVEAQGHARMMDAAGLGRGVVGSQATQQQIAAQTGNAAVGAAGAGLAASNSGNQVMQTGFNQALAGTGQSGSLYGQATGLQNQARGQDLAFLGSVFGSVMSDKNKKKKTGKKANPDAALAEINQLPVEQDWEYDPAKGGPDDGGIPHTGPMAQSVRATMGEQVAPGGTQIDMVSMGGKLIAGMQALTRRIERLEGGK